VKWDNEYTVTHAGDPLHADVTGTGDQCSGGSSQRACIRPQHPGGYFKRIRDKPTAQQSAYATVNGGTSNLPQWYSEKYDPDTPEFVCVVVGQSTGDCQIFGHFSGGVLQATEVYPTIEK
jgi:hypothetical protein